MPSAFISHSSVDKSFVRRLNADLEASGVTTWLDEEQIRPGQSFVDAINNGLASNDFILLVISAGFLSSKWALWETNTSIAAAVKVKAGSVIPLLIEGVWGSVPPLLQDKVYIDFSDHGNLSKYDHSLGRLLRVLHGSKTPPIVKTKKPAVFVTGGRDPKYNAMAFQVAYEFGKRWAMRKNQMVSGVAEGVDECFCRGATESLQTSGDNPHRYLTCYCGRGRTPHHNFGRQIISAFANREEGIPELITDSDVAVFFGGAKNTQYIGVLALLENKVVLPVAATAGAAADLHSIILARFDSTFGDRLDKNRFRSLANINAAPGDLAQEVVELIDLCT